MDTQGTASPFPGSAPVHPAARGGSFVRAGL